MKIGAWLVALLMAAAASAQTVYESKSGQGRVFSDRPMTGGRAVDLPPLNVIESVPASPPSAGASAADAAVNGRAPMDRAPEYRRFVIVFPEQGGSVAANNASFEVRLASEPALHLAQGHAFLLRLNGRQVPGRYTGTELMIPPEVFDAIPPSGVQRQLLEAMIVDGSGRILATATPVEFQTRFVTILQNPHRGVNQQPYQRPMQGVPVVPNALNPPVPSAKPVERPAREAAPSGGRPVNRTKDQ